MMSSEEKDRIWTFKSLQRGDCPLLLSQDCEEALLQWLCGRQHGPAASARRILGDPAADKLLVQRVYRALDATLFTDDSLRPIEGTRAEKKQRYQLLIRAFHPDRYPELEKWLIPRSQSVNAAYVAFRNNPAADNGSDEKTDKTSARSPEYKPRRAAIEQPGIGDWLLRVTAPLSRSRNLPQKVMAVFVVLCTLLLVLIYYANRPL